MDAFFSKLQNWFSSNSQKIIEDLFEFLSFKSVGTDPAYKDETLACAQWVKKYLEKANFACELVKTSGFPVVLANLFSKKKEAKTLLIYGHYDVQPVDPIELWKSKPFEPKLDKNTFFARGAVDNKGQIFYTLVLMRALAEIGEDLDVHIKYCIEGEEECGSAGLSEIIKKEKEKFVCDYLLIVDVGIPGRNIPAITLGTRGVLPFDVELSNAQSDLHSGTHGGLAYNANRALVELLSKLWDNNNHICVPRFYDDVKNFTEEEKKQFNLEFDLKEYKKEFGIRKMVMEKGFSPSESNWIRPTLELNGVCGGYCGPGVKTVIPAKAKAKLSCRLVPNQDPKKIGQVIQNFLQGQVEEGIDLKVTFFSGSKAVRSKVDSNLAQSAAEAYSDVFKKPCKKIFSGASIPIAAEMVQALKCEMVMMGLGLSSDNMHAPNEHFDLERFKKGFFVLSRIVKILGEKK